jgi:hypothetical protein
MKTPGPTAWTQAADALAAILQAENTALRKVDFTAAAALLPAKRAALQEIEACKPDSPKQALTATIHRLDRLAAENRQLLNRSIATQSQVIGIIASAARTAFAFGYGSSGQSANRTGALTFSAKA